MTSWPLFNTPIAILRRRLGVDNRVRKLVHVSYGRCDAKRFPGLPNISLDRFFGKLVARGDEIAELDRTGIPAEVAGCGYPGKRCRPAAHARHGSHWSPSLSSVNRL